MKRANQKSTDSEAGRLTIVGFRAPSGMGAGLFGIAAPLHLFPDLHTSSAVSAITLALIGGAYIGFSAADGRPRVFLSELGVAILFGTAALLALLRQWIALTLGLAFHALWYLLQRNLRKLARVPESYIPLCIVYDLLAASFLILLYGVWM